MRVLIFGLPGSGKTTLALEIITKFPCLYLNADKIRKIFNDKDFSMFGRVHQAKRMRALSDMTHGMIVIADFVCPTFETRCIFDPQVTVWMNTIDKCIYEDTNLIFQKPDRVDFEITRHDLQRQVIEIVSFIQQQKVLI